MRNMHKYEELRPEEFKAEFERAPIVYWGCGLVEFHGLQNALAIDPGKAYEVCVRAAEISGGVVFPMVPFAAGGPPPSWSREELRERMPVSWPSVPVSAEVCEQLYTELMESFADIGFKVCMAFGGHGPAGAQLKKIEEKLSGRIGNMRFSTCSSMTYIEDVIAEEAKTNPDVYGHGGAWETSMNMAVNPEYVDLDRVWPKPWPWPHEQYPDTILRGNLKASLEFGERLVNTAAERFAAKAQELLAEAEQEPAP